MAHIIESLIFAAIYLFLGAGSVLAVTFTISNPQQNGDEVSLDVSLSDLTNSSCPNGYCYMQAAFTAPDPIKYFGYTKNQNNQWSEYVSSPSTSYIQSSFFTFQPSSGSWSGKLYLKINTQSSYYRGAGNYNIKAWRYSGNSTSAAGDSGSITFTSTDPNPSSSPVSISSPSPSSSLESTSLFAVSNLPSQINSDQSFNPTVNLSLPDNPNTSFYLKGAFKKSDSSNYFGLTKVSNAWVKNGSSYSSQYQITTDSSGNWSGNLEVMPDAEDSGFTGSGDYIFKVGRYTSSGSGPSWSNEITVKINSTAISNQGSIAGQSPSSSPTRSSSSIVLPISSAVSKTSQPSNKKVSFQIATVAGLATESSTPSAFEKSEVKSQKQINFPLIVGIALILSGFSLILYIYLRNKRSL